MSEGSDLHKNETKVIFLQSYILSLIPWSRDHILRVQTEQQQQQESNTLSIQRQRKITQKNHIKA